MHIGEGMLGQRSEDNLQCHSLGTSLLLFETGFLIGLEVLYRASASWL